MIPLSPSLSLQLFIDDIISDCFKRHITGVTFLLRRLVYQLILQSALVVYLLINRLYQHEI